MSLPIWPGSPHPLGATPSAEGVNFALFSEQATGVDLCLFDSAEAPRETARLRLPEHTDRIWHGFVPGLRAGQHYGWRVYGPHAPERGLRFRPGRLLLDPYARAFSGDVRLSHEQLVPGPGSPAADHEVTAGMPRAVVVNDRAFDWGDDLPPRTPLARSVIYEMHVRGFTRTCPDVPPELRGTYAGLAHPAAIEYLQALGVTAVELLPVHQHADEPHLVRRGITNYWGYSSVGFFAPHAGYAAADPRAGAHVDEFKAMVRALHAAGIEVILDVVYNHTAEGDERGPTLCFKGIDNAAYYRLEPRDPSRYLDFTGCGNTLNVLHENTLRLVLDSLRYWVSEMRVDGFRFDLAPALLRGRDTGFEQSAPFLAIVHQDPVISRVKLIAEPWDVGHGGYRVGGFPVGWAEWNGRYRDTLRRWWRGDPAQAGELGCRLCGSSDLYEHSGKSPASSINFVASHDGFTLHDLVTYERKRNEANGEANRDGDNHNLNSNHGHEGETDDENVNRLRRRQKRNLLATLFLSQGVPMLAAGDECARTQGGNNNAYCQDNPTGWFDWTRLDDPHARRLLDFTRRLAALRHAHPVFRRPKFLRGRGARPGVAPDAQWFSPAGAELSGDEWGNPALRALGLLLRGHAPDVRDARGRPIEGESFLLLLNAHAHGGEFILPGRRGALWEWLLDTAREDGLADPPQSPWEGGAALVMESRSLALLRLAAGEVEG